MSERRDWPMVNGTVPPRVYVVESVPASHLVTGSPCRYANRASFRRVRLTTEVWLAWSVHERREYLRATLGAFVPPTASCGLSSKKRSTFTRTIDDWPGVNLWSSRPSKRNWR